MLPMKNLVSWAHKIAMSGVLAVGAVVLSTVALTPTASAQIVIGINPPVCDYGYYSYQPYACAPMGFYGPGYFYNGIFLGVGPWGNWGYNHGWGGHRFSGGGGGSYGGGHGYGGRRGPGLVSASHNSYSHSSAMRGGGSSYGGSHASAARGGESHGGGGGGSHGGGGGGSHGGGGGGSHGGGGGHR